MTEKTPEASRTISSETAKTDTKKKRFSNTIKATASQVFKKTINVAKEKLFEIPEKLREHVDIDRKNQKVFLSNALIKKAVENASSSSKDIEIVEFYPLNAVYFCRARIKADAFNLNFTPARIVWMKKQVMVELHTPNGVEFEKQMILTYYAKAIISIFGGTKFGEKILSKKLPQQVRWDGKSAKCTFDLPDEKIPDWMLSMDGTMIVNQDEKGLWFSFGGLLTSTQILEIVIGWATKFFIKAN